MKFVITSDKAVIGPFTGEDSAAAYDAAKEYLKKYVNKLLAYENPDSDDEYDEDFFYGDSYAMPSGDFITIAELYEPIYD